MKKLVSVLIVIVLMCSQIVFAEEICTFDELTKLSANNVTKISIAHNTGERIPVTTSSPLIISKIIDSFKTVEFWKDTTAGGGAGGWLYFINFYLKDGTYIQCSTSLHIDKTTYKATDYNSCLEKMSYYYELIKNVKGSEWASDYILECQELGFLEDITGLSYTEPITREQFCEIVYNMISKTTDKKWSALTAVPFNDTYNQKVTSLYYADIVKGKADKMFAPADFLTREEAATILMRTAGIIGIGFPENAYDKKIYDDETLISDWALLSVHYARKMGIMVGTGNTVFSPKDTYTAEQAITTVIRLYNKYKNS